MPHKDRRFPRMVDEKQLHLLVNAIETSTSYYNNHMGLVNRLRDKVAAIMMFYTCCRPAEILNLSWEDLDLEKGTVYIDPQSNHAHKERLASIPEKLYPVLVQYHQLLQHLGMSPKYLFFSQWTWLPITEDAYARRFQRIAREAGLSKFAYYDAMGKPHYSITPYALRHGGLTRVAQETGNPYAVKAIAGHADISSSMPYVHDSPEYTKKAINNVWANSTIPNLLPKMPAPQTVRKPIGEPFKPEI